MVEHIILRFLLCCISVLHLAAFRCVYKIAGRNGADWFEITSNDALLRQNSFHELE